MILGTANTSTYQPEKYTTKQINSETQSPAPAVFLTV